MSFGENLQLIRNKYNITQEQLAEELDVTRQSVSKWESGVSYPEMHTILKLCEMYQVSMDDLMRGTLAEKNEEEHIRFEKHMRSFARKIAVSVGIIIAALGPACIMDEMNIADNVTGMTFFAFLVVAVMGLIVAGMDHDRFTKKYPVIQQYHTAEEIEKFDGKFSRMIAGSVGAILIGFVILCGSGGTRFEAFAGCGFFLIIAAAVAVMILAGIEKEIYYVEEYNKQKTDIKKDKRVGTACGCIMLVATIVFLLWGFLGSYHGDFGNGEAWAESHSKWIQSGWAISWIAYPVGGILCAIATLLLKLKKEEEEKRNDGKNES